MVTTRTYMVTGKPILDTFIAGPESKNLVKETVAL